MAKNTGNYLFFTYVNVEAQLNVLDVFPDKYDTSISNDFQNFSSGEAKLICVARAIVSNPEILILIYPNYLTTGKLKRICENRTAIILTPDDTFIDFADNTVYLINPIFFPLWTVNLLRLLLRFGVY